MGHAHKSHGILVLALEKVLETAAYLKMYPANDD